MVKLVFNLNLVLVLLLCGNMFALSPQGKAAIALQYLCKAIEFNWLFKFLFLDGAEMREAEMLEEVKFTNFSCLV